MRYLQYKSIASIIAISVTCSGIYGCITRKAMAQERTASDRASIVLEVLKERRSLKVIAHDNRLTVTKLKYWVEQFVSSGASALIGNRNASLEQFSKNWIGTWILKSRVAKGKTTKTEAIMFFDSADTLMFESGELDPLVGTPAASGGPFLMGAYTTINDEFGPAFSPRSIKRTFKSENIGSYGKFREGTWTTGIESYQLQGEMFAHRSAVGSQPKEKELHNHVVLVGDTMIITWVDLDVVDTYERISRERPRALKMFSLKQMWEIIKKSGTLVDPKKVSFQQPEAKRILSHAFALIDRK